MLLLIIYLFIAFVLCVLYVKWKQTYWKRRGLYQIEPVFLLGNFRDIATLNASMPESAQTKYKQIKAAKQKHGGYYMFLEPMYMPIDPVLIKQILQADFAHFTDHGFYHHPNDLMTNHLFNMDGEEWKKLRAKLTPTFSPGKVKMMFGTLLDKKIPLEQAVERVIAKGETCNFKDILGRFTTDVIGSCAFGLECNSLENPLTPLRAYSKTTFESDPLTYIAIMLVPWAILGRTSFKFHGYKVEDYFSNLVKDAIAYREKNNVVRKDFLQLLIDIKNKSKGKPTENSDTLTINEIIAQCFVFLLAGYETSSSTSTFTLIELSRNQEIQERLRQEINDVLDKYNGEISYDALMEMKYLDMVINEALRQYPPLGMLPRICTKTYTVPGTDIVIEKGTRVEISPYGLHNDPDYFPNPEVFNPENFNDENKAKHTDFTFLPFGEGPRLCIGARFGRLQSKFAVMILIRKFKFELNEKLQFPLKMTPANITLSIDKAAWLNATKI